MLNKKNRGINNAFFMIGFVSNYFNDVVSAKVRNFNKFRNTI